MMANARPMNQYVRDEIRSTSYNRIHSKYFKCQKKKTNIPMEVNSDQFQLLLVFPQGEFEQDHVLESNLLSLVASVVTVNKVTYGFCSVRSNM